MKISQGATLFAGLATSQRRGGTSVGAAVLSTVPSYCAKDVDAVNAIPSLEASVTDTFGKAVTLDDVRLLQVHAIIRHGARGPYTSPTCWEGYDTQWDCNVTQVVAPSLPSADEGATTAGLFRKKYDAFPDKNALGGTCMVGQLLDEGYTQEQANGRHLRDAYVCEDSWCLLRNNSAAQLQDEDALYLRSDDEQRTVMSGQILTASMLDVSGAILDWHTGDDAQDYLEPNELVCPRLAELSGEAFSSPDWTKRLESFEFTALNSSMFKVWGEDVAWWDVLDCLMTTACTGRELPDDLTESLFDAAIQHSTTYYAYESLYDDSAYGKLAMASLTLEIRERMHAAMNGTSPLKFVLLSGHDTTLIPFLAAVAPAAWDMGWPPYAALATIELLRVGDGVAKGATDAAGDYFRFVYNGKVLRLDGCDDDICAIDKFMAATQFAEDLQGSEFCCCRNMTQADVDAYNDSFNSTSAPANLNGTASPVTPAPSAAATSAGGVDKRSGLIESGAAKSDDADANSKSSGGLGGGMGIAFACFLFGAVVGGVPALMYFKRFRYESMINGSHSYEMT